MQRVAGRREQALPFFSGRLTWKSTLWLRLEAITLGVRFKTFVCQHDRREQGCNLMRGQREWEAQRGRGREERGLLSGARTRRRALTGGRHPPGSSSHPVRGWIHLRPKRKLLSSLTFCSVQKTLIYCSSIYTSSTGTIVSVHADVTNTVNMWSQDWTCGQTKAPRSSRHDISSILAGRIVLAGALHVFQDRKPAACSSPDRQRGACLYLREVIPLIYIKHQRKPPAPTAPQPSWCDPLQKRLCTLCWPHMHTRDQKQNKQWPFKYQPTCPLFRWRSYCTF